MKRSVLIGGAALVLGSTLVLAQEGPESLLPPGFDDPAPSTPAPQPVQTGTAEPSISGSSAPPPPAGGAPVFQSGPPGGGAGALSGGVIAGLPSIADLEELEPDALDDLLGLKPKFDIPAAARRSLSRVGLLDISEGGMPPQALNNQPAPLVRAALSGLKGPLISRWGHILMRRALVSRLAPPENMNPVEFAALRAKALNAISEFAAARALVQDVDTGNWNDGLTDAALEAYLATSDIMGACPIIQLKGGERQDPQWLLLQSICFSFLDQGARAQTNLNRALGDRIAPEIDIRLAQRYAGAARQGGRGAVNLEWDNVETLTPWRFALATAVGARLPDALLSNAEPYFHMAAAMNPALSFGDRVTGVELSAGQGVLSASAAVDFYSEILALGASTAEPSETAAQTATETAIQLRQAYVATSPRARMDAMKTLWGDDIDYARQVLTAYAAARMAPSEALAEDAPHLIGSMLTAGLDADALTWAPFAPEGGRSWGLLMLARQGENTFVSQAQFDRFRDADNSAGGRKSQMFLAGLAGLGRISNAAVPALAEDLSVDLDRSSQWSRLIADAAEADNAVLVTLLAGVGMQGNSWAQMTPRHLYHIVLALNRVGLSAEARMIATEAVVRG